MLTRLPKRDFNITIIGTSGIENRIVVVGAPSVSAGVEEFLRLYLKNGRLKVKIEECTNTIREI
jgi:hypothetical protein